MKNISKSVKVLTGLALATTLALGALTVDTESASASSTKVMWGKTELKLGQLGKIVITQDTPLLRKLSNGEYEIVRTLKKGEEYRVYTFKDSDGGQFGVGGGLFIDSTSSGIKYQTPSKAKLELLKASVVADKTPVVKPKPEVKPPVTIPPVVIPPVTVPPVVTPPVVEKPETPIERPERPERPVTPVEPPVVEDKPVTEPPVTEPPVTEPPVTEPPVVTPPVTIIPATPIADMDKVKLVQSLIDDIPEGVSREDAIVFNQYFKPNLDKLNESEKSFLDTSKYDKILELINSQE